MDAATAFGTSHPVAVITGSGAPRVGNHVARSLAGHGYRLVLHAHTSMEHARKTVDELSAISEATAVQADLSQTDGVKSLVDAAVNRFGRLDLLVHCASVWKGEDLTEATEELARAHWDLHVLAAIHCAKEAGRIMGEQDHGGAIILIGDWAIARPYPGFAGYFASKGALPTLTRALAVELAGHHPGIRVNAILPGQVLFPEDWGPEQKEKAVAATLVKRAGSPACIGQAVRMLAENDFITGVSLPVDGGRTIYCDQE